MNIAALSSLLPRLSAPARWLAGGAGVLLLTVLLWPRDSVSSMPSLPRAIELMPEDVATVRQAALDSELEFSGTLAPVREMLLNARVAGEVTELPVREGQAVAAGTVLLRQDNRDARARLAQAEAAVQSARAELANAQEQVQKYGQLAQQNFFSRNDLNKATTQAAVYESQLRAHEAAVAVARKELESSLLRAPFAGIVAERFVSPGQLVMPNTPLLRLVDLRELELAIPLSSTDIARVRPGQVVRFKADAFGDEEFSGIIERINPLARTSNRKITVYAVVKNPDLRLRGGLFVHGRLQGGEAARGLVIPATAVQSHAGRSGVMVVREQRLVWQPVTLGARDERSGQVLVTQGLAEGETVLATRVPPERAGAPVRFAAVAAAGDRG